MRRAVPLGVLVAAALAAQPGRGPYVSRLLVGTSAGPYESSSWGEHWQPLEGGLPKGIAAFACVGPRAFAGGADGLFVSDDYGESWRAVRSWSGGEVRTLLTASYFAFEPVVFAGTRSGLYGSRDGGDRWERLGERVIDGEVSSLAWPGPSLFAATAQGLYRSEDGGRSWVQTGRSLPRLPVLSLALSRFFGADPVAFSGLDGAGLYRSQDGGESFVALGGPSWEKRHVYALFWWESSLFAGTDEGLFFSSDAGESWSSAGASLQGIKVYALSLPGAGTRAGSDILAGTERGVFKSSDGARTWRHLTEGMGEPVILGFGSFPFPPENLGRRRKR